MTPPKPRQKRVAKSSPGYGLAQQNRPATASQVRDRIEMLVSENGENGTILRVSKILGINVGYLSQIRRGKRRASNKVLAALGMPCYAPAMVCPVHGVVHQGRCPRPRSTPKSLFDWPIKSLAQAIRERR